MRILTVADYYRHGSARVIEDRASALARRGHQVVLLAGVDPGRTEIEESAARQAGLVPEMIAWTPGHRGLRQLIGLARAFRAAFERRARRTPFDAILFNQPLSAWAVLGSDLARRSKRLYTFHSPWSLEWAIVQGFLVEGGCLADGGARARIEFAARRWIEGRAIRLCDRVTLLSEYMRCLLGQMHPRFPRERVSLIPGGVDLDRFRPISPAARKARKAALGIPADAPFLLTVRRLVPRMGVDNLVRAFAALGREFPRLCLAIGGSGPLEGELRSIARGLGIAEKIRFLGYVPEGALPGLYAAADAFVLPTIQLEGFGLVTVEALACATPVVGTPAGATPEVLGRLDSRLIARDASPAGLAEAAGAVLRMPEAERRALGALGRRRAARFYDAETIGGSLADLLAEMTGTRPVLPAPARRALARAVAAR